MSGTSLATRSLRIWHTNAGLLILSAVSTSYYRFCNRSPSTGFAHPVLRLIYEIQTASGWVLTRVNETFTVKNVKSMEAASSFTEARLLLQVLDFVTSPSPIFNTFFSLTFVFGCLALNFFQLWFYWFKIILSSQTEELETLSLLPYCIVLCPKSF